MRAASRAIAFEPAGDQVLRGKAAPVPAWRAGPVVAERRGRGRPDVLEPPFVGRAEELRALKEALHATERDRRPRLVSVTGPAGIGKSRLAWELEKYVDGLVERVYWHAGRSLAHGEGVAVWALGEMVRRRAGLAEGDDEPTTRAALDLLVAEWVPGAEDRRWVEPALLTLFGLEPAAVRRTRRPLRRLADPLRADRGPRHDGPRVRGSPVGGRRPPRLHRAPPRVGEGRSRSSWSPSPGPSCSTCGPAGAPGRGQRRRLASSRSRRPRCRP